MFEATKIIHQNSDWITLILVFVLFTLSLLKVIFKDRLYHESTLFFSKKYLSTYFNKEKNLILNLFQAALFIVKLLVLSILFYFANVYFKISPNSLNFNSYLLLVFGVALYFSLHFLIGLLLAFLFNFKNEYTKVIYSKIRYFNNLILWLLPFLIFSIYAGKYQELLFRITFVLFGLLLLLRYSFILLNNKKFIFNNLFYFILYLCALEIAPLIIVLKLTV